MISRNFSRFPLYPAVFLQNDPPASGDPAPTPQPSSKSEPQPSALERAMMDVLARNNNDSHKALETLVGQVHRLTQRAENAEAKIGKLPDDVAAELEAYRAYGKPDELKQRIESGDAAQQKAATLEAEKVISEASGIIGYKADVLTDLAQTKNFKVEVRGEGDSKQAFAVYQDGDKPAEKPLNEYVEATLPAYLPALQVAQSTQQQRVVGTHKGAPLGTGKATTVFDRVRQEMEAKNKQREEAAQQGDRLAGVM